MSAVRTSLVKRRHAYTGVDVPWSMDTPDESDVSPLFRYLRGGGVRAFGSTSEEAALDRRQTKFLAAAGVLAALWVALWFL